MRLVNKEIRGSWHAQVAQMLEDRTSTRSATTLKLQTQNNKKFLKQIYP